MLQKDHANSLSQKLTNKKLYTKAQPKRSLTRLTQEVIHKKLQLFGDSREITLSVDGRK